MRGPPPDKTRRRGSDGNRKRYNEIQETEKAERPAWSDGCDEIAKEGGEDESSDARAGKDEAHR